MCGVWLGLECFGCGGVVYVLGCVCCFGGYVVCEGALAGDDGSRVGKVWLSGSVRLCVA